MAKYNVVWTRTADIQFIGILEYWVKRNKSTIFRSTDFKDIRVASLDNFSIYFKATETQIIISAFWDNRQNPKKLLNILQNSL